jgi:predicted ATPase/class 3 adenylate cyclase
MSELPTGTVTFLFTDLEGSTRLWEEHPDEMRGVLARHDEILRDAVASHDGQIVKTTGDGVHAVFADPQAAITAAVAAQETFAAEPTAVGTLRVRIGIHTGPAELRAGDYYGTAVNRAARLMSAAHGGQVVLSLATAELVRDDLPAGVELLDLGEHQLRDLARPEHMFQVVAPGIEREHPPLRTLDAFPGNLPAQLTSFVGRDPELAGIAAALADHRLVTITGAGGVGKTRLAIQVAAEVLPHFRDGAWLCELAAASDADAMRQVLVATLVVQPRTGASLEESILDALRAKDLLLVFDNCEHLLRPVRDLVSRLLQQCPRVRIIVTSREGLGVAGEQVWPLRSLDVPDERVTPDEVAASEAGALFGDRACSVRPDFRIDDANAAAVADICRRLDGIPLALELAAARTVAMSAADIAARLDERFRLLTGGREAAMERHQTLRSAVDWSYSLLEPRERIVFDRLAVFSGSFDARAAEAVVSGEDVEGWDVLDALTGLVAKSMLVAEPGVDGSMRYQLLETMRQYASERLAETADTDTWRRRHGEHYAVISEEIARGLRGADEGAWRTRLDAELDNLRAVVQWSTDAPDQVDAELGLRIIASLSHQASFSRSLGIGVWAERASARAEDSTPARRSDVLGAASYSALVRGEHELAHEVALDALSHGVCRESWSPGLAYLTLSYHALATGRHDELRDIMAQWRSALDEIDADEYAVATGHWVRGSFGALLRDPGARDEAETAMRIARRLDNPTAITNSMHALAMNLAPDSPDEALTLLEQALGHVHVTNDNLTGNVLSMIAQIRARQGDRVGALEAVRDAIVHTDRLGDRPQLIAAIDWTIAVLRRFGHVEPAAVLVGAATEGPLAEINNFPGAHRLLGDDKFEPLEAQLGVESYEQLVRRGAAMSHDEMMRYAVGELDRLVAAETPPNPHTGVAEP